MSKDNKFKKENIDPFPSGSATKFLVSINITLFFLNAILSNHVNLVNIFGLSSKMTGLTIWQPITYMFIQNNLSSFILMNVTLWFFGNNLESLLGRKKYLLYYFFIGASSGLVWLLTNSQSDTILIGPLGAVVGLIVAIGMLNPNSTSYWYFMIPIKTISFVKLLFVLNLIFHFRGYDYSDLVLSAMLIGFIYMKLLSRS